MQLSPRRLSLTVADNRISTAGERLAMGSLPKRSRAPDATDGLPPVPDETHGQTSYSWHICSAFFLVCRMKSDTSAFHGWRLHELTDGVEDDLELRLILLFQRSQFPREFNVRSQHLAEPDKGTDDCNTGLHCHGAVQHIGNYEGSMFGESIWCIFDVPLAVQGRKLRP